MMVAHLVFSLVWSVGGTDGALIKTQAGVSSFMCKCHDFFQILEERTNMMVAHLLFSLVWSVGGTLDGASRLKFDEFFRSLCEMDTSGKYPR